jgi:hypothetical protein
MKGTGQKYKPNSCGCEKHFGVRETLRIRQSIKEAEG